MAASCKPTRSPRLRSPCSCVRRPSTLCLSPIQIAHRDHFCCNGLRQAASLTGWRVGAVEARSAAASPDFDIFNRGRILRRMDLQDAFTARTSGRATPRGDRSTGSHQSRIERRAGWLGNQITPSFTLSRPSQPATGSDLSLRRDRRPTGAAWRPTTALVYEDTRRIFLAGSNGRARAGPPTNLQRSRTLKEKKGTFASRAIARASKFFRSRGPIATPFGVRRRFLKSAAP